MKYESTTSLKRISEQIEEAQKELCVAMHDLFPVGSRISWNHQYAYQQFGTVVRVSDAWWSDMCLTARNERTGNVVTVWLHMQPEPATKDEA